MPGVIFKQLHRDVDETSIFVRKVYALGKARMNPSQRAVAAIRMSGYGVSAGNLDAYIQMGEDSVFFVTECVL